MLEAIIGKTIKEVRKADFDEREQAFQYNKQRDYSESIGAECGDADDDPGDVVIEFTDGRFIVIGGSEWAHIHYAGYGTDT